MEIDKLKSIVNKAQEAVKEITNEDLKKIAFQKILDSLLNPTVVPPAPIINTPVQHHQKTTLPQEKVNLSNLTELFSQKNPKSHPDMILTFAYYFHFNNNQDFNIEDIFKSYKQVLIPVTKNPTDIINSNIRKGFINKQDKRKGTKQAYHITKYGIDYVNNNFSGKSRASSPSWKKKNDQEN